MMYKVLVVDDSPMMRAELSRIIEQDPQLTVVGTASNGKLALDQIAVQKPDVVTLDINMPVMDGLETLTQIMQRFPLPVVMVSSLSQEGAQETLESLALGAFDYVAKPMGGMQNAHVRLLRAKIVAAAKSKVTRPASRFRAPLTTRKTAPHVVADVKGNRPISHIGPNKLVAIGVSTGGPKALMKILPEIPADFSGAVLIAQHMPATFTGTFAARLNGECKVAVKEAEDGEEVREGVVYIAPGGKHMEVAKKSNAYFIKVIEDLRSKVFVPSVEILFESMTANLGKNWLGIMLTGMGSDGSKALADHYKAGGHSIVESEESCVVFGMPGKVLEFGGAGFVLPCEEIIATMISLMKRGVNV